MGSHCVVYNLDLGCILRSILVCVNLLFAICLDFVFPVFNIFSDLTIWVLVATVSYHNCFPSKVLVINA